MSDEIKIEDWARLAAFIDSEGCITIGLQGPIHKRGKSSAMRVQITNTDPRLMKWLRKFGVGSICGRTVAGQRYRYDWYVGANQAAELLRNCLPYFVMKRDQAELAIAFQETKQYGGYKGKGITPEMEQQWRDMGESLRSMKAAVPAEVIQ